LRFKVDKVKYESRPLQGLSFKFLFLKLNILESRELFSFASLRAGDTVPARINLEVHHAI
jgi:hypothetical protein